MTLRRPAKENIIQTQVCPICGIEVDIPELASVQECPCCGNMVILSTNLQDSISEKSFERFLEEIATYLSSHLKPTCNVNIKGRFYMGVTLIVVGNPISFNRYSAIFIKKLWGAGSLSNQDIPDHLWKNYRWSSFNKDNFSNPASIKNVLEDLQRYENNGLRDRYAPSVCYGRHLVYVSLDEFRLYIIFWNLFLCSLDDDIYNEQLPLVIELAHCFHIDEHIMRDLCRGVEYVLSGKKLSPNCDLQCDTVEGAYFFLGKEE